MITWQFKHIITNEHGRILEETNITEILNDWELVKKLGDELWIESGEISLERLSAFPLSESNKNWMGVYLNGSLYDVFYVPQTYEKVDQKKGRYTIELDPIQKIFYDDCKDTIVGSLKILYSWSYNIGDAALTIDEIRYGNPLAPEWILNRWGFSLGDLLEMMVHTDFTSSQYKGYLIKSMTGPWPTMNNNNLPIIFRGISKDKELATLDEAVAWTFEDYNFNFLQLLSLGSFAWNSWIKIKPVIWTYPGYDYLAIDITFQQRINVTPSDTKSPTWLERKFVRNKYQIDGVRIYSTINDDEGNPTFEYTQGDPEGDNVFEKGVDIGDPESEIDGDDKKLYWCLGQYIEGDDKYDITVDGENMPYFGSGLVEVNYADMITDGHGYEGEILYKDEDVLNHLNADTDHVMQVNQITIPKRGPAEIEGIQIQ